MLRTHVSYSAAGGADHRGAHLKCRVRLLVPRGSEWRVAHRDRVASQLKRRNGHATANERAVAQEKEWPSPDGADADAGADEAAEAAAVAALASPPPRLADFGALMSRRPESYEVRLFVINAYSLLAPRVHLTGFDTGDNTAAYLRLALGNKVRHKSFAHETSSPRARASIVRRTQLRARHTRVICAPNMRHTCVTYVSHTRRMRVTYASNICHACVTHACAAARAPFPLLSFVVTPAGTTVARAPQQSVSRRSGPHTHQ